MGDVVNLRRARKSRQRREQEKHAQENRAAFGRPKVEIALTATMLQKEAEKLDRHRRTRLSENDS